MTTYEQIDDEMLLNLNKNLRTRQQKENKKQIKKKLFSQYTDGM